MFWLIHFSVLWCHLWVSHHFSHSFFFFVRNSNSLSFKVPFLSLSPSLSLYLYFKELCSYWFLIWHVNTVVNVLWCHLWFSFNYTISHTVSSLWETITLYHSKFSLSLFLFILSRVVFALISYLTCQHRGVIPTLTIYENVHVLIKGALYKLVMTKMPPNWTLNHPDGNIISLSPDWVFWSGWTRYRAGVSRLMLLETGCV